MPASLYEHALIQKCCDGDRTAYREVYDLYAAELLAIALRYMKTRPAAEDVVQEAFIKAFKNLAAFNRQSALKTWLTRIVINTALTMLRREHQNYNWHSEHVLEAETAVLPLHNFGFEELIGFITRLPAGCRSVFNLYALEGYTHKEIAALLNISEGTSKSQYARAKGLLRQRIMAEEKNSKLKVI